MEESFPKAPTESTESTPSFERINRVWTEGFDVARPIKAKSGRLALGTEVGLRTGENEDTLVLDTEHDAFAVVDGMGGYEYGEVAARIVAEEIQRGVHEHVTPSDMQRRAHLRMQENGIREGGACYAAGQIIGKKLNVWHAGDVELMLVDRRGTIKFAIEETSLRNAPRGLYPGTAILDRTGFMNYDRIIVASDGLLDNVDIREAVLAVKDVPVEEALKKLNMMAREGMVHGYGDGNYGNKDNITILIYEILPVPLRGKL